MKPFSYARPATIDEASALLREEGSAVLAGGSQLLLSFHWAPPPKLVVNIKGLTSLRGIDERDGDLWMGALTTFADLQKAPLIAQRFPVLAETAYAMATPTMAEVGTIGGNVAWASPQADMLQSLLLLDADVELSTVRTVKLRDFLTGPSKTALQKGELITGVRLKGSQTLAVYLRHSARRMADAQICSVALTPSRAVIGSCGPTPVVVDFDEGLAVDDVLQLVAGSVSPRDDFRATAAYRLELVRNLTRRGLEYVRGM